MSLKVDNNAYTGNPVSDGFDWQNPNFNYKMEADMKRLERMRLKDLSGLMVDAFCHGRKRHN